MHQAKKTPSSLGYHCQPPRTMSFTLTPSRFLTLVTTSAASSTTSVLLRRWQESVWKTGQQAEKFSWGQKLEALLLWNSQCLLSAVLVAPSLLNVREKVLSRWGTSGTRRMTSWLERISLSSSWIILPWKTLAITVVWSPQRWHFTLILLCQFCLSRWWVKKATQCAWVWIHHLQSPVTGLRRRQILALVTKWLLEVNLSYQGKLLFRLALQRKSHGDIEALCLNGFANSIWSLRYAQQPMAIGEKINLKFEVSCGRPVVYEWMKRGVREDVTVSPPEVSVRWVRAVEI